MFARAVKYFSLFHLLSGEKKTSTSVRRKGFQISLSFHGAIEPPFRKLHSTVCSQVAGGLLSRLTSRKIHLWSRSSRKQYEKRIRLRRLVESGNFQFVNHVSIRNPIPILDQIGSGNRWLWKKSYRLVHKTKQKKIRTPLAPFF